MSALQKIFSSVSFIGLLACLAVIIWMKKCSGTPECYHPLISTDTTRHFRHEFDSTRKTITPASPAVIVNTQTVPVPANVDTAEILRSYHAVRTFSQTFRNDSLEVKLWDTLSQNMIKGRKFTYKLIFPVKTIESTTISNTVLKDNSGFFAGVFICGGRQYFGAGPQLQYLFPNQLNVGAGYDLVNRNFLFTATFKLHAGRKH